MHRFKGYLTVEASFVVPIVIGVFVVLIYLANYMYGRCILVQDCYTVAFETANMPEKKRSVESALAKGEQISGKKYFGNRKPVYQVQKSGKKIEVIAKTQTKHKAMGRFFLKPENGWEFESIESAKSQDYSKHIRTVKRLMDIELKEND